MFLLRMTSAIFKSGLFLIHKIISLLFYQKYLLVYNNTGTYLLTVFNFITGFVHFLTVKIFEIPSHYIV